MTRPATDRDDGVPVQRKATLFCWECDHSSPVDGDWSVEPRGRCVAYVCPECETTLTKRPRSIEPSRDRAATGPLAAWQRTVRASAMLWRASVDVGVSSLAAFVGVEATADIQGRPDP
ncbi:hypothetical protein [Natrinema altunense]|uniref:DUF8106 domain-containing protein n=1 Tax=Natrinema altunense (strain JCM 12890 / CGMCC 1.3731 / AJ2) TaxID=1227494 RepID=L9ZKU0_NATA2|nr:hypothetical protein [Natrinema altunense]ELY86954.1 hypothetical protein C485_08557 [Natrinema altunense JCM 12890]